MPLTDLALAKRLDSACDSFEAAWRAGRKPRIEDLLGNATGDDRAELLKALIAVEIELRRSAGEEVKAGQYRKRFADEADAVASAFAEPGRPRAAGETSASRDSVKTSNFEARTDTAKPAATDTPKQIGRFSIRSLLGAGAFGRVYRAKDPQLGREVALKVPLASAISTPADRERFLREARAAAGLHHPNICPVHEVGEENGHPFIVMGFVPGQSLAATLKARKEPLAPKQAALIARKLALALDAAHMKGVVHRDLKPANVMFDKERRDVVVTDFGLARAPRLDDSQTTRDGVLMGTPAYMSPEQARGDTKAVGPASDQYSLGVMLYEMLAGRRPFTGTVTEVLGKILHVEPDSPATLRPDLDPALVSVCLKAMAKAPAARYASMREFADVLLGFASDTPLARPATGSAETAKGATETQRIADVFAFTEKAVELAIRKHRTPTWMKVALGMLILIGLVVPGIVFFARTPTAKVTIQIDVDIHDKSLAFILDGKPIEGEALTREIELKVGKHVLEVKRDGQVIRKYEFNVSKDAGPRIELKEEVPEEKRTPIMEQGFAPLFNGKDLSGWQPLPEKSNNWSVVSGVLTGSGKVGNGTDVCLSNLRTTRDDYSDFHLRAEVRINESGNGGIYVRSRTVKGSPSGYEVEINPTAGESLTGSIRYEGPKIVMEKEKPPPAGQWFTMEVITRGATLTVLVNGIKTAELNDPSGPRRGYIALQQFDSASIVEFRNIQIKELPLPAEDGFVHLFNGKDLTGWQLESGDTENWKVRNGVIAGIAGDAVPRPGTETWLLSDKEYQDFHLRYEFRTATEKVNSGFAYRIVPHEKPGTHPVTTHLQVEIFDKSVNRTGTLICSLGPPLFMEATPGEKQKPHGEWNQMEIEARGQSIRVKLNGNDLLNESLDTAIAKGGLFPGLKRSRGRIGFQRLRGEIQFREIQIKDLSAKAAAPDRDAAEWVLRVGGKGRVYVEETDATVNFGPKTPLPDMPFRLVGINLQGLQEVANDALAKALTGLRYVEELRVEPDPETGRRTLDFLGRWDRLKSLWVNLNAKPGKATLATLVKNCPNLETLELVGYRPAEGLSELPADRNLKNLFFFYSDFGADDFEQIKRLRSLTYVHFGKCGESEADAAALRAARPGLRVTREPR